MTKPSLRAFAFVALLACGLAGLATAQAPAAPQSAAPVQDAASFEKGLREAMLLPADTRIIYLDHEGKPIPAEQFAARAQEGISIDVKRDEAAGTVTFTLAAKSAEDGAVGPVKVLPQLDLRDLYGRRIRNLDLAGRPTLINFFYETCVPCIKEAPVLTAYRRKHGEFNYLAVTFESEEVARRFVAQRNFDWPVAYDGQAFIDAMKVKGYPTYVLVAADGRILGRGSGMDVKKMNDVSAALADFEKWVSSRLAK